MVTFTEEDFAGFTRILSSADLQELDKAEKELEKRGFDVQGKKNALTLLRAFDQAKHIPITFETLIKTVETYKDSFDWLSPDEIEYQKLSGQLGQQKTDAIWSYFPGYRLESTYSNFNALASFFLTRNVDSDSFRNAFGNVQSGTQGVSGSRDVTPGRPGQRLEFKTNSRSTVESHRVKQEMDAKERANTPVTKVEKDPDAAMPEASDYRGVVRPLSGHLKQWAENQHRPSPVTQNDPTPDTPTYWQRRTQEFLANIPENVIRAELEQEFSTPKNANWEVTYRILENTYNRRKTERIMSARTI